MKKIGIYDPYFDILGGAERYVLSIAQCLDGEYEIVLYGVSESLLKKAELKFGIRLDQVEIKPWPKKRNSRLKELRNLNIFFCVTDGSIFWSPAKKNILIIQSPAHTPIKTLTNRIKLFSWHRLIVYSQFMANIVRNRLHREADVLFVPIEKPKSITTKREQNIISVGRFFAHLHNKKQLEMVSFFKRLVDSGLTETKLHLVGSVDPGSESYLEQVKQLIKGYPITIHTDISHQELCQLYAQSKIYWHAAGFGEDLTKYPERAEHFGVVTLEAMSYGVVPLVFKAGGQIEIVDDNVNGFLWKSEETLQALTKNILADTGLWQALSEKAKEKSSQFNEQKFCNKLYEFIKK